MQRPPPPPTLQAGRAASIARRPTDDVVPVRERDSSPPHTFPSFPGLQHFLRVALPTYRIPKYDMSAYFFVTFFRGLRPHSPYRIPSYSPSPLLPYLQLEDLRSCPFYARPRRSRIAKYNLINSGTEGAHFSISQQCRFSCHARDRHVTAYASNPSNIFISPS